MSLTQDIVPGLEAPVALIGIAEKGYVSYELSIQYPGGHSSMPEADNAITLLSKALLKIHQHPFPARITEPTKHFLNGIGSGLPWYKKMIFANQWLFSRLISRELEKTSTGNACLRTTISPTIFKSGVKENLVPTEAKAIINFRILPGETSESVGTYIKEILMDSLIKIKSTGIINEPSPVSDVHSSAYQNIEKSILQVFPGAMVFPSLVLGATDSKHYVNISKDVYRFLPVNLGPEDLQRVHGINERIATRDFTKCIEFYYSLVKNSTRSENE